MFSVRRNVFAPPFGSCRAQRITRRRHSVSGIVLAVPVVKLFLLCLRLCASVKPRVYVARHVASTGR